MELIREIEKSLSVFKRLYDVIRVVDPLKKEVIFSNDNNNIGKNHQCYSLWNRNEFCTNCISMRAYINNDSFIKVEYDRDKIFLMTAVPICIDGYTYIAEILKDITNNGSVLHKIDKDCCQIGAFINSMNKQSVMDKQTGLCNKRYIKERLPVDINYSKINGLQLSIIMAEIDCFEKLDEVDGQVIEQNFLADFSNIITKSIKSSTDWAGRYGERKFVIVLNNTNLKNAYIVAEKIKNQLENHIFQYNGVTINIASSFGVYSAIDNDLDSLDLLSKVEKNLYLAKLGGQNRIISNQEENDTIYADRKVNNIKLEKLDKQINEMRDVLNEVCCTKDDEQDKDDISSKRLVISQFLDELIVEYMKEVRSINLIGRKL